MPITFMLADGIRVTEGLDALRRRPGMYLGPCAVEHGYGAGLVEIALDSIVNDTPAPTAVRLTLWRAREITIAFDGEPLPIHPVGVDGISHPALYSLFLHLTHARRSFPHAGCRLNALSEKLIVSTVVDGARYWAGFSRGGLVSLLRKAGNDVEPLGTTWLTFLPDPSLIPE
ncbi:MAG: hypothetical protein K8W52_21065 [Deltaproteobacteria bacterium]|nr:hypothetical protein [Deltaproteobacteria bacterium]